MTIRFFWVTDIPAPYRNHQFERMAEIFPAHDIEMSVHFMAWTDRRRPWKFAADELHYPWQLHDNPVESLARRGIHVNPGLFAALRRGDADVVMIGGWASPSHVISPFVTPNRVVKILGCESHLDSVVRDSAIARAVKRRVVRRYDAFLVPGARSRELICTLDDQASSKPFVTLPNVIDARLFRDRVATLRGSRGELRRSLGVPEGRSLWFCPARLIPMKGLVEFIPILSGIEGIELLIAGEGELRAQLEQLIASNQLPVRLLGQQPEERMLELYAAADVFVLPSQADPSPLSAVEAAAAELPLLLSNRAGNSDDLVVDGENGWILDVAAGARRRTLIERVALTPRSSLAAMGRRSGAIYQERFDSDTCVRRLAEFVIDLARKPVKSRAV